LFMSLSHKRCLILIAPVTIAITVFIDKADLLSLAIWGYAWMQTMRCLRKTS
jgi:hypothetical protein